jgi:hypothetical protein
MPKRTSKNRNRARTDRNVKLVEGLVPKGTDHGTSVQLAGTAAKGNRKGVNLLCKQKLKLDSDKASTLTSHIMEALS